MLVGSSHVIWLVHALSMKQDKFSFWPFGFRRRTIGRIIRYSCQHRLKLVQWFLRRKLKWKCQQTDIKLWQKLTLAKWDKNKLDHLGLLFLWFPIKKMSIKHLIYVHKCISVTQLFSLTIMNNNNYMYYTFNTNLKYSI